jgi:hypothetical protein
MKCWYRLNLDTSTAIKEDYKFVIPNKPLGVWHVPALTIFNPEWLRYTESNGLSIDHAMVFYRGPDANAPTAHVDLSKSDKIRFCSFGINWTIGGKGSEMVWYDKPKSGYDVKYTESGNPFMDWSFPELTEVDRAAINSELTLVKVDYPHTVSMKSDPRWCISARTKIRDDLPWNEVVNIMRSKNLLVER